MDHYDDHCDFRNMEGQIRKAVWSGNKLVLTEPDPVNDPQLDLGLRYMTWDGGAWFVRWNDETKMFVHTRNGDVNPDHESREWNYLEFVGGRRWICIRYYDGFYHMGPKQDE